jgi:hypothetical protein
MSSQCICKLIFKLTIRITQAYFFLNFKEYISLTQL